MASKPYTVRRNDLLARLRTARRFCATPIARKYGLNARKTIKALQQDLARVRSER